MNKYARLNISGRIDVAVIFSSGDTSADIFTIILEVDSHDLLAAFICTDLTNTMIHIFTLFRIEKKICSCIISNWHIMEIPCEHDTFFNKHIKEVIACYGLIVLACVADRSTEQHLVSLHCVKCFHDFIKRSISAASVVLRLEAFNADCRNEVSNFYSLLTELIINKGTICECHECTVVMLLAKIKDIVFTHKRFTSGKKKCVDTEFLCLRYDTVH